MDIHINKVQTTTLLNAIRYFEYFVENEVLNDSDTLNNKEKEIIEIDNLLQEIYDDLFLEIYNVLNLDVQSISALLSALSVYISAVENNIKTPQNIKQTKSEKDLTLRNASELQEYLFENLANLDPAALVKEFNILPNTDWR